VGGVFLNLTSLLTLQLPPPPRLLLLLLLLLLLFVPG
jgi:hypothetical protein